MKIVSILEIRYLHINTQHKKCNALIFTKLHWASIHRLCKLDDYILTRVLLITCYLQKCTLSPKNLIATLLTNLFYCNMKFWKHSIRMHKPKSTKMATHSYSTWRIEGQPFITDKTKKWWFASTTCTHTVYQGCFVSCVINVMIEDISMWILIEFWYGQTMQIVEEPGPDFGFGLWKFQVPLKRFILVF